MNFGLEHNKLPEQHTPHDDKTPEGLAFVTALLRPLKNLYERFMAARAATLYKLQHTSQVIYLEKVLNGQFNNGLPAYTIYPTNPTGIYIADSNHIRQMYRWNKIEARHDAVRWNTNELTADPDRKSYRYSAAEISNGFCFTVMIPNAVGDVNDAVFAAAVSAWVNYYRQAGSRFSLQNY